MFDRLLRYMRAIPKRKHYLEFITATLSVPVLATAIILNVNNLKANDTEKKETPTERIVVSYAPNPNEEKKEEIREPEEKTEVCTKKVGPVEINNPVEGDTVTDNPLEIRLKYDAETFCQVVWSYRINNGKWSEYDDKSFAVYNLPNGPKTLEVRVKSIASSDEKLLKRTFDYEGTEVVPTQQVTTTPEGQ